MLAGLFVSTGTPGNSERPGWLLHSRLPDEPPIRPSRVSGDGGLGGDPRTSY